MNRERERERGSREALFFHSIETHESRRKRKKSPPCHFFSRPLVDAPANKPKPENPHDAPLRRALSPARPRRVRCGAALVVGAVAARRRGGRGGGCRKRGLW